MILNDKGIYETTGVDRTGCCYCAFGMHLEKGESRFEKLKKTHPKQYDYSIGGGEWEDNPYYIEGCLPSLTKWAGCRGILKRYGCQIVRV